MHLQAGSRAGRPHPCPHGSSITQCSPQASQGLVNALPGGICCLLTVIGPRGGQADLCYCYPEALTLFFSSRRAVPCTHRMSKVEPRNEGFKVSAAVAMV